MKLQIFIFCLLLSLSITSTFFADEKKPAEKKIVKKEPEKNKSEKELRKEFKEKIKEAKNIGDKATALELLTGCKEKKSFKLILSMLREKNDLITISVMNTLGSCDDSTNIPMTIFIKELKNKKNNILVRGIAAKKLSTRGIKTPALEALFSCIQSLNVSNTVRRQKIGNSGARGNNPPGNGTSTPEDTVEAENLQQIRENIQGFNDSKNLNPDNIKLSKLAASILLADTCMRSIHQLTKEKQHVIKGNSVLWWNNEDKNKSKARKWWKANKNKFKKEDQILQKELKAKAKAEKEKAVNKK